MKNYSLSATREVKNGEFVQFVESSVAWFDNMGEEKKLLEKPLTRLKEYLVPLGSAFQKEKKHKLTADIKSLNTARVNSWKSLKKVLQSHQLLENSEEKNAATLLFNNFNFHDNLTKRVTMPQRTASINALLSDWKEQADLVAAIDTLGIQKWVNDLTDNNAKFTAKHMERTETRITSVDMKTKRAEMTSLLTELLEDAKAYSRVSDRPEVFLNVLEKIENRATEYKLMVKMRNADRKSNKSDSGPPPFTAGF